MKKILSFLFVIGILWISFSFANTCKEFSAGKVCLSLENNGNGSYKVKRNVTNYTDKNMLMLNCKVLTPTDKLQDIWTCQGNFAYAGNWNDKVSYIVYLEWEKKRLEENYKFDNISSYNINKIKSVFNMWPNLISSLEEKYPSLETHNNWQNLSDAIYNQMDKILSVKSNYIKTYDRFEKLIKAYVKYTIQLKE